MLRINGLVGCIVPHEIVIQENLVSANKLFQTEQEPTTLVSLKMGFVQIGGMIELCKNRIEALEDCIQFLSSKKNVVKQLELIDSIIEGLEANKEVLSSPELEKCVASWMAFKKLKNLLSQRKSKDEILNALNIEIQKSRRTLNSHLINQRLLVNQIFNASGEWLVKAPEINKYEQKNCETLLCNLRRLSYRARCKVYKAMHLIGALLGINYKPTGHTP